MSLSSGSFVLTGQASATKIGIEDTTTQLAAKDAATYFQVVQDYVSHQSKSLLRSIHFKAEVAAGVDFDIGWFGNGFAVAYYTLTIMNRGIASITVSPGAVSGWTRWFNGNVIIPAGGVIAVSSQNGLSCGFNQKNIKFDVDASIEVFAIAAINSVQPPG